MLQVGNFNTLKILNEASAGYFLDGGSDGEILLPFSLTTAKHKIGDEVAVFLYHDSEDRLIATTESPTAKVGEFAHLKVVGLESVGAFLNWGLSKDLFLPYREITRNLKTGDYVVVYIYLDKTGRIASTMRFDKHADKATDILKPGEKVDLMVAGFSDLGYKAIINGKYLGVLYDNEIFEHLEIGQKLPGYIKKVREDKKVDLLLQPFGNFGTNDLSQSILDEIAKNDGHSLRIDD